MDQARTSKSSFYIERKKDKLTLKNLLDIWNYDTKLFMI
jgi:hypothetical protein